MVTIEERIRSLENRLRLLQKLPPIELGRTHLPGVAQQKKQEEIASRNNVSVAVQTENGSEMYMEDNPARGAVDVEAGGGNAAAEVGERSSSVAQTKRVEKVPPSAAVTAAAEAEAASVPASASSPAPLAYTPSPPPPRPSSVPALETKEVKPGEAASSDTLTSSPSKKVRYVLKPKKPQQKAAEKAEDEKEEMSIIPKRKFRVVCKPKETQEEPKKPYFSSIFSIKNSDLSPFDLPAESQYFVNKKKCGLTTKTVKKGKREKEKEKEKAQQEEKEKKERRLFYPAHQFNVGLNPSFTEEAPSTLSIAEYYKKQQESKRGTDTATLETNVPSSSPASPEAGRKAPVQGNAAKAKEDPMLMNCFVKAASMVKQQKRSSSPNISACPAPGTRSSPYKTTTRKSPSPSHQQPHQSTAASPPSRESSQKRPSTGVRLAPINVAEVPFLVPTEAAIRARQSPEAVVEEVSDRPVATEEAMTQSPIIKISPRETTKAAENERRPYTGGSTVEKSEAPQYRGGSARHARRPPHETLHTCTEKILLDLDAAGVAEEEALLSRRSAREQQLKVSPRPASKAGNIAEKAAPPPPPAVKEAPRAPVPPPVNPPEPELVRPAWLDQQLDECDKALLNPDSPESKVEYDRLCSLYGKFLDGTEEDLLELWDALGGSAGWQKALRPAQLSLLLSQEQIVKVRFRVDNDWLTYLGGTTIREEEVNGFFSALLSRLPHLEFVELFDCKVAPFSWDTIYRAYQPFRSLKGLYFLYTNWSSTDVLQMVQLCPGIEHGKIRTDTHLRCIVGLSAEQLMEECMGKVLVRAY